MEAPNLLPMKGLFVTKFESNEGKHTSVQLQINGQLQKGPPFWWLLSPIALKDVGPLLLD